MLGRIAGLSCSGFLGHHLQVCFRNRRRNTSRVVAATRRAERFTREIMLAAALQEPHIVPVHCAALTGGGRPYYIIPFVRGDVPRAARPPLST
jgi:hypothetical protein